MAESPVQDVQNPPAGTPRVTPYLLYEDLDSAVDWLVAAFGFSEQLRLAGPDGRANHAELRLGEGLVMMGNPGSHYRNPKRRGGATQIVYVYVDDVDKHFDAAKAAGAQILREPADQFYGDRTYAAEDPEGHQWSFAQHVRDVPLDQAQSDS
jgi:PhnB protein